MDQGRAAISVLVYDGEAKKYVWAKNDTETSLREQWFPGESLAARQDQALYNAIRKCLEPFIHGKREAIQTPTESLVVKVVALINGGKQVMLDLGSTKGIHVGDVFDSFETHCQLTVTQVFENGSLADVANGPTTAGEIFKSAD